MSDNDQKEIVHGYEIKQAVVFENNRGFALAENPNAVQPFVTWQFTEGEGEGGGREYYWGHYMQDGDKAQSDFDKRIRDYRESYGLSEKGAAEVYKYYSTQRPVDIGTFPKTESGPLEVANFDRREPVEYGRFTAWGYLLYAAPLTQKQLDDYELRPAFANPDRRRLEAQAQVVGRWEQAHRVSDTRRLTWYYSDFGVFVAKEFVTPERLSERHGQIVAAKTRADEKRRAAPKPIAEQLAEAAKQMERGAETPAPGKNHVSHEDR